MVHTHTQKYSLIIGHADKPQEQDSLREAKPELAWLSWKAGSSFSSQNNHAIHRFTCKYLSDPL